MIKKNKSFGLKINLLCIATLIFPAAIKAQEDLFDLDKLADFGTKKYKMTWIDRRSGQPVEVERGTMVLAAKQSKDSVLLKNVTRMYMPDGKRFIEYQAECDFSIQNKKLALQSTSYKVVRRDKVVLVDIKAKVMNGKIIQENSKGDDESTEERTWTNGTYPDLAVFFLIPQLSQTAGKSVKIENVMTLPYTSETQVTTQRIACLGKDDESKIDGQALTKFVNQADGEETGIDYWVDSKGQLRRVLLNAENRLDLMTDQK